MAHNISTKTLQARARRAYREGRLTAQQPNPADRKCTYSGPNDSRCAIGAVLPPTILRKLCKLGFNGGYGVRRIGDIVTFEDRALAWRIQCAHDAWASAVDDEREHEKSRFLRAIGVRP